MTGPGNRVGCFPSQGRRAVRAFAAGISFAEILIGEFSLVVGQQNRTFLYPGLSHKLAASFRDWRILCRFLITCNNLLARAPLHETLVPYLSPKPFHAIRMKANIGTGPPSPLRLHAALCQKDMRNLSRCSDGLI